MERRKPSLLKYWLTLIIGTIVLTAGITWLVMNVGAQGMPDVIEATGAIALPPHVIFDKEVKMTGNTIDIDAGRSFVGKTSTVEVGFVNEGPGTLRMKLLRTSCKCIHDLKVNGEFMAMEKNWVETPAGKHGVITFSWKPEKEQLSSGVLRISAEFQVNDPQPHFSNGLRLEIVTWPTDE